ncbi:MAG: fibronectin type III domain-containing protein [Acidobacteria bacterium]|nr:fibronectin type III domain-containing protein [Acidobacteriota bacterium]
MKVDGVSGGGATVSWTPSPEKGVASYIVAYGPPANPLQHRVVVAAPQAKVTPIASGHVVSVKAVNANGLEGWSWATATVP